MTDRTVIEHIASSLQAQQNCIAQNNLTWAQHHETIVEKLIRRYLPAGSGFDVPVELSKHNAPDWVEFKFEFHHLNEHGYYDGWTAHAVRVRATLTGLSVLVKGPDRNNIKDYATEMFYHALTQRVPADTYTALVKAVLGSDEGSKAA